MIKYYPPRMPKLSALIAKNPDFGGIDFLEEQR